jgi:transcriptional regulator with XRE-family HTH domain
MGRPEFAKCLGLSRSYLFKVETGQEKPSLEKIEMISAKAGISLDRLIIPGDTQVVDEEILGLSVGPDLRVELNNERALRLDQAFKILEMERALISAKMECERRSAVIKLHEKHAEILCDKNLSKIERNRKIRELSKTTAKKGDVTFGDILSALRFNRADLKRAIGMTEYKCKLEESISVEAMMPEGAALQLRCSVCAHRQHGECVGYGVYDSPLNIKDLVDMLKETGFTTGDEHAKIITDCYYRRPVTAHDVAEAAFFAASASLSQQIRRRHDQSRRHKRQTSHVIAGIFDLSPVIIRPHISVSRSADERDPARIKAHKRVESVKLSV